MDFTHPVESVIPGAQGRVLAVMAETTAELNLRTIAQLSEVSVAQASRILPPLVESGLVERRDVPPSSLFRLAREHVAAGPLLVLSRARDVVITEMGIAAGALPMTPESVVVFGSFARGKADAQSDIDVVLVRPAGIDDSDEMWADSVEQWRNRIRQVSGNRIEVLEVGEEEVPRRLRSGQPAWIDIRREGVVVFGRPLGEFAELSDG